MKRKNWEYYDTERADRIVVLKKDPYDWLWNAWYVGNIGSKFAGPFATRSELADRLERLGWARVAQ